MQKLKQFLPHTIALAIFFALASVYFYPVYQGYKLRQGDIKLHKGMSQEYRAHKAKYDDAPLWVGNMFGGMPSFQISSVKFDGNIIEVIHNVLMKWVPYPVSLLILYMIGFYILLLCLKIDYRLAIVGAIGFAFSSYFIVIIEAGHTSKAFALAYMPGIIGGYLLTKEKNLWLGLLVTALFTALQFQANHLQITYYTLFILGALFIADLVHAIKHQLMKAFLKRISFLAIAGLLGALPNIGNILLTYEYSKSSTRSPSELTIEPDGKSNDKIKSTGLEKDYITQWSYGIGESLTLMIPKFKGGRSGAIIGLEDEVERLRREEPQFFNFMVEKYQKEGWYVNTYWGNMPFTSGPVYAGVIICLLAFLSLMYLRKPMVYALLGVSVLTLMLAWGKNFMPLTEFFIDHFPMYNKFRAVTMILVVVEFALPLLAILFLAHLIEHRAEILKHKKKLYIGLGIFVGFLLINYLMPSLFNEFISDKESTKLQEWIAKEPNKSNYYNDMFSNIESYRADVFKADILGRLLFVIIFIAVLMAFVYEKIQKKYFILVTAIVVGVDLWMLDKEFLNNSETAGASKRSANRFESYTKPNSVANPFNPTAADLAILQQESNNNPQLQANIQQTVNKRRADSKERLTQGDMLSIQFTELMSSTHYRVLNSSRKMDEDAETAFFHKNLGGYHGAKIKKYQELISFKLGIEHFQLKQAFLRGGRAMAMQLLPAMNMTNMLNAKYIIGAERGENGMQTTYIENPYRLGNAWFVDSVEVVKNADEEITRLKTLNPANKVLIQENESYNAATNFKTSSANKISLQSYSPEELVYNYSASSEQFAVFSEIYYGNGWNAYLNDELIPHFKVNYILRGMPIPKGSGQVTFKFEPKLYALGNTLSWISSAAFLILIIGISFKSLKPSNTVEEGTDH